MTKIENNIEERISNVKTNINGTINQMIDELRSNDGKMTIIDRLKTFEENINHVCSATIQNAIDDKNAETLQQVANKLYKKLEKVWNVNEYGNYDFQYVMSILKYCANEIIDDTNDKTIDERIDVYNVYHSFMQYVFGDSEKISIICTYYSKGRTNIVYSKTFDFYSDAMKEYFKVMDKMNKSIFMIDCKDIMVHYPNDIVISEEDFRYTIKNNVNDECLSLHMVDDNSHKKPIIEII